MASKIISPYYVTLCLFLCFINKISFYVLSTGNAYFYKNIFIHAVIYDRFRSTRISNI